MPISSSELGEICNIDNLDDFGGFRVSPDGLYVILPGNDVPLTSTERLAISWHPTGNFKEPALPLPCTPEELRAFVANAGLLGCIDEFVLDEMVLTSVDQVPPDGENKKPPLQQLFQEQEILRVIHELSYDPKNLPKQKPGKPGVKAMVRHKLSFSVKVFDKAWGRLRSNKDI